MLHAAVVAAATAVPGPSLVDTMFREFRTKFNASYGSDGELSHRRAVFARNVERILVLNGSEPFATFTHLTPWADLAADEFTGMHGLAPRTPCQFVNPPPQLKPSAVPKSTLDYVALGATVAVKNQGKCSSCWAHATTALAEGALWLSTRNTTSLSEQFLLDCDSARVCQGCCGGLPERAVQWLATGPAPGSELRAEALYPYASAGGTDPSRGHCNTAVPPAARLTGFGIVQGKDGETMRAALTQYGVLAVSMDSTPLQFYKSGVITNPSCPKGASNHAVAIVGYGTEGDVAYWKVRNSYGAQFGEDGYFRIERQAGAPGAPCQIADCIVAGTGASWV